jgi:hypothetical protein
MELLIGNRPTLLLNGVAASVHTLRSMQRLAQRTCSAYADLCGYRDGGGGQGQSQSLP